MINKHEQQQDELLINYIDGLLSDDQMSLVHSQIAEDQNFAQALVHLQKARALLRSQLVSYEPPHALDQLIIEFARTAKSQPPKLALSETPHSTQNWLSRLFSLPSFKPALAFLTLLIVVGSVYIVTQISHKTTLMSQSTQDQIGQPPSQITSYDLPIAKADSTPDQRKQAPHTSSESLTQGSDRTAIPADKLQTDDSELLALSPRKDLPKTESDAPKEDHKPQIITAPRRPPETTEPKSVAIVSKPKVSPSRTSPMSKPPKKHISKRSISRGYADKYTKTRRKYTEKQRRARSKKQTAVAIKTPQPKTYPTRKSSPPSKAKSHPGLSVNNYGGQSKAAHPPSAGAGIGQKKETSPPEAKTSPDLQSAQTPRVRQHLDGDTTSKQPDRASKSTEPEPLQPTTPQKPPHTPSPPRYAPPPPPIAPKSKHRPSASPTPGSNDPYGSQRSDPPADPQILENTAKGGQLRFQHLLNEAEQSRQQYQKSRSRSDLQRATTRYRLALKYAANQEQHSQTLWQFGLLYLHAKQHTQADNYFQQSIALLPRSKHINAYRRLVDLYSQAGYNSGAMGYLQRLIQLDPPNAPQYRRKLQRYQK